MYLLGQSTIIQYMQVLQSKSLVNKLSPQERVQVRSSEPFSDPNEVHKKYKPITKGNQKP
jgi:hypothetical protein